MKNEPTLNYEILHNAINQLAQSERGVQALRDLLHFFDNGAISLDARNQQAVIRLFRGIYAMPSIREHIQQTLTDPP